ncbi:hypothetical protein HAHE_13890 [Haloferula helveola]|uniref:Uncharacterized protein n=1 Tax=Haloferula helveola TaxID=490095 RepID=A0ABM7R8R4_9BACT|nr:hypothetical protein HAHE_13890 [Haloferula helveola]
MSEIKFACPNCDQHVSAGPEWFGREVACPNCQFMLTVPGEPQVSDEEATPQPVAARPPGGVRFLAWYYLIGAAPFILFALFGFTIPPEEFTNHPEYIDRDRGMIQALKVLMFGGMLLYAVAHAIAGTGLLRGKGWAYIFAWVLTGLGLLHLNLFAVAGLIVCLRSDTRAYFARS